MAARTNPRHGDQAVNTRTGELATIIDVHEKAAPPNVSVLREGADRLVVWQGTEVEWTPR